MRLWDLASGELIKEMKGHTDTVHCLEFSTDGSLLCSGITALSADIHLSQLFFPPLYWSQNFV